MARDYDMSMGRPVILEGPVERQAFLAKVYSTFTAGLVLALLGCVLALTNPAVGRIGLAVMGNPLIYILTVLALTFGVMALSRTPGINLVAFGAYTTFFGILTAPLIMMAAGATGSLAVVYQALGLTVLVFGGLSVWALTTREDLGGWGKYLLIGGLLLVGVGLIGAFTSFGLGLWYNALAVTLIAGFTMYDTQMIQRRYPATMWVAGAVALFTDFLMMFWQLLMLLTGSRR
ncbi:MAG TPA: Bax inhibitor-1 family protein, partial [bacterium]|nr:Bax inhibitor-1 family protein [bacterium]